MDRPTGAVAAYARQHRPAVDAVAFTDAAETALDREDTDGCASALRDGLACVESLAVGAGERLLWHTVRSLRDTVTGACLALTAGAADARTRARRAIRALRRAAHRLGPTAGLGAF